MSKKRREIDIKGDALIEDLLPDELPEMYAKMPYIWVERLWRYCLWVWVTPQEGDKPDKENTILYEDSKEPLFHKFKLLLIKYEQGEFPLSIYPDFQHKMDTGFKVITKSWLKVSAGEVTHRQVTFLEHYLLILEENPDMELDEELLNLLKKSTKNSKHIISIYRKNAYKFLGTMM
jgi:hypothetical protein